MSVNENAGPFLNSEAETIREHYKYMQRREEHQSGLRVEALRMAIQAVDALGGSVVGNAEEFYKFLSGKS